MPSPIFCWSGRPARRQWSSPRVGPTPRTAFR
jgi:hypothetical protein